MLIPDQFLHEMPKEFVSTYVCKKKIVAVVRGKNKRAQNAATVTTVKICDNVFTLRFWKF